MPLAHPDIATAPPDLGTPHPDIATAQPDIAMAAPDLAMAQPDTATAEPRPQDGAARHGVGSTRPRDGRQTSGSALPDIVTVSSNTALAPTDINATQRVDARTPQDVTTVSPVAGFARVTTRTVVESERGSPHQSPNAYHRGSEDTEKAELSKPVLSVISVSLS